MQMVKSVATAYAGLSSHTALSPVVADNALLQKRKICNYFK